MDALMVPILQAPKATVAVEVQTPAGKKIGSNFSDYMEKKLATESRSESNLFGLPKDKAAPVSAAREVYSPASQQDGTLGAATIAALLAEFVQYLQKSAEEQKLGPGEWSFPVPDPGLLQKIARDAGMNESRFNTLLATSKSEDGKLSVVDFLASFSRHFQTLQDDVPVTVPETALPLLQSFLERLGVPVPEMSRISEAAVRGDNTLDLQKFLAGLKDLPELRITDITALEAEQLQDLLAEAGISGQLQRALLPERLPVIEGLVEAGPSVTLTLDRLKNMLEQAIGEVKANRLQANPLSFLAGLQEVLVRSGFETNGPSLSSAVQGSVVAIFEKLMESVDLAKVKVNRGSAVAESVMEIKDPGYWQEDIAGEGIMAVSAVTSGSEPDLPLLQLLLERLGVPVTEVNRLSEAALRGNNTFDPREMAGLLQRLTEEKITDLATEVSRLSEAVVRGDNTLDLQKVAELLQGLTGVKIKDLTAVEAEQLQNPLADSDPPVVPALDLLKNMLAQGVREVKANRLQADPLSFLADLHEVLSRIGFETNSPRRSSAVQGNLVAVFEELAENVDLAKVKVSLGSVVVGAVMEKKDLGSAQESGAGTDEVSVAGASPETGQLQVEGRDALVADGPVKETGTSGELFAENNGVFQNATAASAKAVALAEVSSQAARPFVHIPNLPHGLQQQSFAQLSQGVLQGLRNQEHHLVLTLHPKELGEVKVEMTVRDNQVAVSFVMENSRVKEVLESNLEQFRENMEKHGFTLGDCMVSLNRDNNGNEAWQQFQTASQEKSAGRRRTTLADLPDDILYQRVQPGNGRANGVDLFA